MDTSDTDELDFVCECLSVQTTGEERSSVKEKIQKEEGEYRDAKRSK